MSDSGPIIVDLGLDDALPTREIDALSDSIRRLADGWRDLVAAMRSAGAQMGALGQQQRQALPPNTGPNARVARAQQQLANARQSGDPNAMFDAQYRLQQATDALTRAQNRMNGGGNSAWMTALMTSRFNMNVGGVDVQPLAGRSLQALTGSATKAAGVLAAVAVAGIALKSAFDGAIELARDRRNAFWGGGASSSTAEMMGIGRAVGMDGAAMASLSRQVADRMLNDPIAQMMGRRAGVDVHAGAWWGSQDTAGVLTGLIDEMRSITDDREAVRFARQTGIEDLLGLRDLSPGTLEKLRAVFSEMGSAESRIAASEYEAQVAMLGAEWDQLKEMAGTPLIELTTGIVSWINDFIKGIGGSNPETLVGGMRPGAGSARAEVERASRAQIDALNNNTRAIDAFRREVFGGGNRARSAIPKAWFRNTRLAAQNDSIGLGAFGI